MGRFYPLAMVAAWTIAGALVFLVSVSAGSEEVTALRSVGAVDTPASLLANSKAMMAANPEAAVQLARAAEIAMRRQPVTPAQQIEIATAQWLAGEGLMRLNDVAAATPIVLAALQTSQRLVPSSKLTASLLASRAGLHEAGGHLDKALNDYQRAFAISRRLGDQRAEAVALQNIGSIYQEAADYERVLYYYGLSAETYPNDPGLQLSSSNNRANALDQLGRHREAELEYERALAIAVDLGSPAAQARILDNLAQSQIEQRKLGPASRNINRGLALAAADNAAGWYPLLLGTAARLALSRGDASHAIILVERALRVSGELGATAPYRDLQRTAYEAYRRSGDLVRALEHFEIFKRLDDQGRSLAASTTAALASARFDFANQNSRIDALKTGQLQRDIALARLKARQLQIVIGALLVLAAVGTALLSLYLRSLRRSGRAIASTNTKLSTVNAALEDALLAKTQFLATTSHEIRTPLNGVLGMTQVLLADPAVTGDVRERVALMHRAGETMRNLVNDILDVAKSDADAFELDRKLILLPALLQEAVDFWADKARASRLTLSLDLADCPETIVEDEARLRQIVHNIVANAIKFTLSGEVSIGVGTCAVDGAEHLEISCTDTGVGIPESRLDDIFEKFVQLDSGITRQFGGTGLGLAICRKLSRAMGGDVAVASTVGAGSRFTISLPLHRGPKPMAADRPVDRTFKPDLALANIVVVQSNPFGRGVLGAMLSAHVGNLNFVDTLGAALAKVEMAHGDLVLVDGSQAVASGVDAVREIRDFICRLGSHKVPVVLLWPADQQHSARLALEDVCALLLKPVSADKLLIKLRFAMESANAPALRSTLVVEA